MGKPVVKLSNQSTSFFWGEGKEEEGVEGEGVRQSIEYMHTVHG